jgi:hypothetical protein
MFKVPENKRMKEGFLASDESFGCNGIFIVPINNGTIWAQCTVSDQSGWEHLSVTLCDKNHKQIKRCPTWLKMCDLKNIFWDEEDCVIQLHPPKSDWVNCHEFCLHLWRPVGVELPRPPYYMIGIK